ncbi:hypothetical protein [Yoonia sp. R2-816]|uniref:hypothetical protein n=1 Tax=Yoonia sp. R2-816 TaxID=3342638 RepID=UPI00372C6382
MADSAPSLSMVASATVQGINAEQGHGFLVNVTDILAPVQRSAELRRTYVEKGC